MIHRFAHPAIPETDLLPHDRRWRAAVLWTIRDLQSSVVRCRTLSLSNLCRLFDRRWRAIRPAPEFAESGCQLGRAFLKHYYFTHQPFHPTTARTDNNHCGA